MDGVRRLVQTAHCKVVNLSIGGDVSSITEQNFYQEMRDQGVLLVCRPAITVPPSSTRPLIRPPSRSARWM